MPYWDLLPESESRVHNVTALPMESRKTWPLTDSATAVLFGGGGENYTGEYVNEGSALSLTAVFRAVSLISQGIAALPLKSYTTDADDQRKRVTSFLDNPAGPDSMTPFEWKETVLLHLVLHGDAFLYHVYTDGGALVGLTPVHPLAVTVETDWHEPEGKVFWVSTEGGGQERLTTREMTHIVGPHSDGLRGWSFLSIGRNALGIGLAAERSAAGMFRNGAQIAGVLTPAAGEDISDAEARTISADLDQNLYGRANAGRIPLVNRILEFHPWQMTNMDAQWLESRKFQIEEVSRLTGVPPFLLFELEKTTSWGTGISEQNTNLAQYVFLPWCKRISERLSRLIPGGPRFCEFDFAGLEAGSQAQVSALLMGEVNGGIRTLNEARRILNLAPVAGGDELRIPSGVMLQAQLEASAAQTVAETDAVTDAGPGTTSEAVTSGTA